MSELEVGQTVRIDVAQDAKYGGSGRQQLPVDPGTVGVVTGIREMQSGCDIQIDRDAYFYRDELTPILSREELKEQRDELLAACEDVESWVSGWMDFGENPCPFCDHHHNHDNDCPLLVVEAVIAKARGTDVS